MSLVLKHTTRSNIGNNMYPEQNDGEPFLEIIENAKSRGFRFRYTCEGPSHGGIPGCSSDRNKKTFPAVRICNYQGYARIVVQLVTNEENPRLHPHSLVGKQCQNGICTVQCGPRDMTATFPNLGIQHVTKKNVATILEERYIAAEMQLSSISEGFPSDVQKNIKVEDRRRIAAKAQAEAKSIDLAVVRLMFIAYLPDSNGAFTIMLKPVISFPIYDSKAPNAATLKICRMDCNAGSAGGGDEVYLLCDKVQKDDIQVRFFEENHRGETIWENFGNFAPTDVHRQFAIVFKTPPYRDQNILSHVNVNVQLRRKSDQEVSESKHFTYLPSTSDFDGVEKKKRKILSLQDVMNSNKVINITSNHQLFQINTTGNNSNSGGATGGNSTSSGGGTTRTTNDHHSNQAASKPKEIKQEFPIDPRMIFQQIKTEKKENYETTDITQVELEKEVQYIPGTRIPMRANTKKVSESVQYKPQQQVNVNNKSSAPLSPLANPYLMQDNFVLDLYSPPSSVTSSNMTTSDYSTISAHDLDYLMPRLTGDDVSEFIKTSESSSTMLMDSTSESGFDSTGFSSSSFASAYEQSSSLFDFSHVPSDNYIFTDTGDVALATSDKKAFSTAYKYNHPDEELSDIIDKFSQHVTTKDDYDVIKPADDKKQKVSIKFLETVVKQLDKDGITLLDWAVGCKDSGVVESLVNLVGQYKIDDPFCWNVLHLSAIKRNYVAFQALMSLLKRPWYYLDIHGNHPGHIACLNDDDVIMNILLKYHHHGDNDVINQFNYNGETMYHICARRNSLKCLQSLFQYGYYGDVNALTTNHHDNKKPPQTAVAMAIQYGNYQCASMLIVQHGARFDLCDFDYDTDANNMLEFAFYHHNYHRHHSDIDDGISMTPQMSELLSKINNNKEEMAELLQQDFDSLTSKAQKELVEILMTSLDRKQVMSLMTSLTSCNHHDLDDVEDMTSLFLSEISGRGIRVSDIVVELTLFVNMTSQPACDVIKVVHGDNMTSQHHRVCAVST